MKATCIPVIDLLRPGVCSSGFPVVDPRIQPDSTLMKAFEMRVNGLARNPCAHPGIGYYWVRWGRPGGSYAIVVRPMLPHFPRQCSSCYRPCNAATFAMLLRFSMLPLTGASHLFPLPMCYDLTLFQLFAA